MAQTTLSQCGIAVSVSEGSKHRLTARYPRWLSSTTSKRCSSSRPNTSDPPRAHEQCTYSWSPTITALGASDWGIRRHWSQVETRCATQCGNGFKSPCNRLRTPVSIAMLIPSTPWLCRQDAQDVRRCRWRRGAEAQGQTDPNDCGYWDPGEHQQKDVVQALYHAMPVMTRATRARRQTQAEECATNLDDDTGSWRMSGG